MIKSISVAYLSGMHAPALLNDFKGQIVSAVRVSENDNLFTVGTNLFMKRKN
jgi:putative ABC transport system permease protein